jgi:hypothetical protein
MKKIKYFSTKNLFYFFVLTFFIFNSNVIAEETLFVSPQEINFGEVKVGVEKRIKILITNTKDEPVQIQRIKFSNSQNFWVDENGGDNPCGSNKILQFREKCTMEVNFLPFEDKKYSSELKFYTSDDKKTKVKVYGEGIQIENPKLVIDFGDFNNESYDFGYIFIGDSFPKMFTIKNRGKGLLVFRKEIFVSDDEHFKIDPYKGTNPCNSLQPILAEGESCTFIVYFNPDEDKKYKTELKFYTNDPENDEVSIKMYGRGTSNPIPKIEVEKVRKDFVDTQVGQESNLMVIIKNKGNGALNIIKMELSDNENFRIDVNGGIKPCKSLTPSIYPRDFCTIYVKFNPDKEKTYKTSLKIYSTDVEDKKVKISLKGKGERNISETSNSESLTGSAGCNFGLSAFPIYLLVPLIFIFRRFKTKFYK